MEAIEEQFSRLDAAEEALRMAGVRLRAFKTSVLHSAASGAAVGQNAATWPARTVGEIAVDVRYGSSKKTRPNSVGIPVLRMGNVVDGRLRLENLKFLPEDNNEFPALLLQPGDVLFNRTNSPELVGKAAVYRGVPVPCSYASYLIRVRLDSTCLPDWLCYYLSSPAGRLWAKSVVSQQVGQANINGTKLKALALPLPAIELQAEIVRITEEALSIADAQGETLLKAQKRAQAIRRSLLSDAFAGRLVRYDAAALHERVTG